MKIFKEELNCSQQARYSSHGLFFYNGLESITINNSDPDTYVPLFNIDGVNDEEELDCFLKESLSSYNFKKIIVPYEINRFSGKIKIGIFVPFSLSFISDIGVDNEENID